MIFHLRDQTVAEPDRYPVLGDASGRLQRTNSDAVDQRTVQILNEMLGKVSNIIGVRFWNGASWPDDQTRQVTLVLQHPAALTQMFSAGTEVGLAEAYLHNDFDIEGNIAALFEIADVLTGRLTDWKQKLKVAALRFRAPKRSTTHAAGRGIPNLRGRRHSLERDREAVTSHYDLSNDFYRLWLDERMVYSCAYFASPDDSLDEAQEWKLDYLCRKLRLRVGQHLLDIGCGWGGLILHAAKHFGVRATGITLSARQAEWARARIAEAELEATVKVCLCDYRNLSVESQPYDAIVSVGMAEHVGREQLPNYFAATWRLLKPGGVFMNQAIGEGILPRATRKNDSFIDKYVFPDGDIPPLPIMLQSAESSGFEIRDVENLREHYALTLEQWLHRLEAHYADALRFVSEETYRTWRLYLAGSGHGFRRGHIAVYQTLMAKPEKTGAANLPLTRNDWYPVAKNKIKEARPA
jgi:cyclopropane-fatty-acyl-phospholipid synthase